MNLEQTCQRRVQRGMEWLDRARPGWEERIDLRTLYIENGNHCIIGQLFGSYDAFPFGARTGLSLGFLPSNGFLSQRDNEPISAANERYRRNFIALNAAWKTCIEARRKAKSAQKEATCSR